MYVLDDFLVPVLVPVGVGILSILVHRGALLSLLASVDINHVMHRNAAPCEVVQNVENVTHNQSIGKSRGGLTTEILALVDALENLVRFRLMPGQRGETTGVVALLEGLDFGALLGDKAYDADWLRRDLQQRGVEAVIPSRAKRLNPANYDAEKYKWRHLLENFFQRLKEFPGIAMRSCKTDSSFPAIIYLAATVLRTR